MPIEGALLVLEGEAGLDAARDLDVRQLGVTEGRQDVAAAVEGGQDLGDGRGVGVVEAGVVRGERQAHRDLAGGNQ